MTRSYVYMARRADKPDLIKIGISGAVGIRMYELSRTLKTDVAEIWSCSLGTCSAGQVEYAAHHCLADCRVEGEWFAVSEQEARRALAHSIRAARRREVIALQVEKQKVSIATSVDKSFRDAVRERARRENVSVAVLVERILRAALSE